MTFQYTACIQQFIVPASMVHPKLNLSIARQYALQFPWNFDASHLYRLTNILTYWTYHSMSAFAGAYQQTWPIKLLVTIIILQYLGLPY